MKSTTIPEFQHREHRDWLQKIDFYQDQIKLFQKELAMVLHQHPDLFSIIEHVDEYRDILLKKLTKLDELRRQIILHEKNIVQTTDTATINLWDHIEVRDKINSFEKNYESLKQNFRGFVAHHIKVK